MSTQEHNKRVAYGFYEEVFNSGRLEVMDELASAALVARDGALPPGLSVHGPEPYKRTVAMFRAAFPDLRCEVEEMVAENDTVAVRVIMNGTHLGNSWACLPPASGCATQGWTSSTSRMARWWSIGPLPTISD